TRVERRERANGNGERARPDDETSTRVAARPFRESRGGRNGPARRGRITRVLEGILTAEQMKEFQALRDEWRETTRPAIVWTESPNGLQPHGLLLGLSDDSFSEVLRGELKEGDRVVSRVRRDGGGEQQSGRRRRRPGA